MMLNLLLHYATHAKRRMAGLLLVIRAADISDIMRRLCTLRYILIMTVIRRMMLIISAASPELRRLSAALLPMLL